MNIAEGMTRLNHDIYNLVAKRLEDFAQEFGTRPEVELHFEKLHNLKSEVAGSRLLRVTVVVRG